MIIEGKIPPEPPKKKGIAKKELLELLPELPLLLVELPVLLLLVVLLLVPSDDEKDPDLKSLLPDVELEELPDLKLLLLLLLEELLDLNPDDEVLAWTIVLCILLLSTNVSTSEPKFDKLNIKASIKVNKIFLPTLLILSPP